MGYPAFLKCRWAARSRWPGWSGGEGLIGGVVVIGAGAICLERLGLVVFPPVVELLESEGAVDVEAGGTVAFPLPALCAKAAVDALTKSRAKSFIRMSRSPSCC